MRRALGPFVITVMLAACGSGQAREEPLPTTSRPTDVALTPQAAAPVGPELVARPATISRPAQPAMTADLPVALVGDHCLDRDLPAPAATEDAFTLLDRSYALASSYVPADLVPAARAGFEGASGTKLVRAFVIEDLAALLAASRAAGLELVIESGYRSWGNQAATFDSWAARIGHAGALVRSARPGHSEHQLGTAIDVTSPGWGGRFGDWARETAEGVWLAEHAWEYGFVMSYPAGAQDATCFSYEPWHYRWIGRGAAAEQHASGLPLRTFLERYVDG